MTTTQQAVIYTRVSLDKTGEGLAVDRQEQSCRQLAAARGWTVTEVLTDNSISAAGKVERPGFNRLVEMIESGRVQVVVAWAVDRLTRSLTDLEKLIVLAEQHSVAIATVTGDLDLGNDQGRMIARILASVARGEIERKSARQRAAGLQVAQLGKPGAGRRPFGYEPDGETIRPAEAEAIRSGYQQLLSGVPLGQIARDWNAAGFTSGQERRGEHLGEPSPWRRDSVRYVLSNPRNVAERWYRGELIGPATWPAIVDEATFRAAVALLTDPGRMTGVTSAQALLTGLAICGTCFSTVHAGGGRGRGTRTYRCSGTTGHVARRGEPVDAYLRELVIERLTRSDARDLLVDHSAPDVAALRQEAVTLRARQRDLAVDFADGILTSAQLRAATERLRDRLAEVEAQMADAGKLDLIGPLIGVEDVAAVWDGLGSARQRAVLAVLFEEIVIHAPGRGVRQFDPRSVTVRWGGGER